MSMRRFQILSAVALLTAFLPVAASADETVSKYRFSLDLGGQFASVSDDSTRFEKYQDVPDGVVVPGLSFELWQPDSPWSFSLTAKDAMQDDQRWDLSLSNAGRFRLEARWDETPHLFARNARSIYGGDPGYLTINETVRAAHEANPASITSTLAAQGKKTEIGFQRERFSADAGIRLARGWDLGVDGATETRQGDRPISAGTYIRRQGVEPGTGVNSFDRERMEPRGQELLAPVDYKVDEYGLSTSFQRAKGFFHLGWQGSSFRNDTGTLRWDNPFESTPGAGTSLLGLAPQFDQEPPAPLGIQNNRGRFASSALDLWPDNDYERLNASGGITLPGRTRINGAFAMATMKQDDPFLAFTENPFVFYSLGADGRPNTADDVLAKDLPLPRASLEGKIETTNFDLTISSRPLDPLTLRGSWRMYDYDDRTPEISLPGYAAAGDSYFRRGVGQRDAAGNKILVNETGGYTRTAWSVGGGWKFGDPAQLDIDYRSTTWDYDERQVEKTTEEGFKARLRLNFSDAIAANLTYSDDSRTFDGPYSVGLETSRLRAFDVWDRDRTRYGIELDFTPGDTWNFGVAWSDWQDDYPGANPVPTPVPASNPFGAFPYGLNEANNDSLSAYFGVSGKNWDATLSAGRETSEWKSMATAKTSLTSDSIQFDPTNRWLRNQDDAVDWADFQLEGDLSPDKLRLIVNIGYSQYDGNLETTNPATPNINSGVAYDFPNLSSSWFSGKATVDWTFNPHMDLEFSYLYEPYRLDDFQWDNWQPYMQGVVKETAGSPTTLRNETVNKFLFLDSGYSDYTASVATIVAKLHF